tara:strand:+ start:3708 stop:3995 length:288 start_codon:yes stop_codon:yes gene_type:complete
MTDTAKEPDLGVSDEEKKLFLGQRLADLIQSTHLIDREVLREVIREGQRFDTLAPIFDPTMWIKENEKNKNDVDVLVAVEKFLNELYEIKQRIGK